MPLENRKIPFYLYFRTIINVVATIVILIIGAVAVTILAALSLGKLNNWIVENVGCAIGRSALWVTGVRMHMHYLAGRNLPPAIYISNHSSTLDMFVILGMGLPRVRFVAKYELQYNPMLFIMGRLTGQIFIIRQNSQKAIDNLRKAYARIKKQRLSLYVAPEGTRGHAGVIGPFKKGAFRMAIDLGYPIVPIYFEGARELCLVKSLVVFPGEINVWLHPPIDTSDWKLETLDQHIEQVREMYMQWAAGKSPRVPFAAKAREELNSK